jgi:hypothetical protein
METLLNTFFYKLVKNDNDKDIQKAYNDFIKDLFSFCKSVGDTTLVYFALNYTRIEFISIQNGIIECKSKKK